MTVAETTQKGNIRIKYILLGIGSAALVPAFLKMISSDLIKCTVPYDNISYLIFAGFCLVAAIFSRRFITTIGDRILEAAKKAEVIAKESKSQNEKTQIELSATKERVEDINMKAAINSSMNLIVESDVNQPPPELLNLVDSYIEKTSIPDYAERLKTKAEIGRKMGVLIVQSKLSREKLFAEYKKEAMYLAIAYSIELRPDPNGLDLLLNLAQEVQQLYTKYVILVAIRTLASAGFINKQRIEEIKTAISVFRNGADKALNRNLDETMLVLSLIDSDNLIK